jgi:hypothetical protein
VIAAGQGTAAADKPINRSLPQKAHKSQNKPKVEAILDFTVGP